jgi:hypothetical protein
MKSNVGPIAEETGATSMALKQIASNRKASHPLPWGRAGAMGEMAIISTENIRIM